MAGVGSSTSLTLPPSSSIAVERRLRTTAATPGLEALLLEPPGAEAQAVEPLGAGQRDLLGRPSEVESQGSWPSSARSIRAASVTSRVSGPHWSSDEAKAIIP